MSTPAGRRPGSGSCLPQQVGAGTEGHGGQSPALAPFGSNMHELVGWLDREKGFLPRPPLLVKEK